MAYKVRIYIGKGKNRAVSESTVLANKENVANWVKKHPLGNANTKIEVRNVDTGKVMTGRKLRFRNPDRF